MTEGGLLSVDLELQLAVSTTAYHWLQAFHDLQWRGKPDRKICLTHWPEWLQAEEQRAAVLNFRPGHPAARAPDGSARGRTLALHTVLLANPPFALVPESSIHKLVALPPRRVAMEPTECPLSAENFYTSRAMLEHLAWHAVHATACAESKVVASQILRGRAQRSAWHAPYAKRHQPGAQGNNGLGEGRGTSCLRAAAAGLCMPRKL